MAKVFIISDCHFPFQSKKSLKKILDHIKAEKPTHVVQIGDLLDQYVFSKYTKNSSVTPEQDITAGLEDAQQMWRDIKKIVPRAKCVQLLGNHDVRLAKRIAEKLPELAGFFSHKQLYSFKGVEVLESDRDYKEIDGVIYVHGWLSKSIDHCVYFKGTPVVHGHRHRPAIETAGNGSWSMDVGYVASSKSVAMQYTSSKFSKWTEACGVVEGGKPRLIFL